MADIHKFAPAILLTCDEANVIAEAMATINQFSAEALSIMLAKLDAVDGDADLEQSEPLEDDDPAELDDHGEEDDPCGQCDEDEISTMLERQYDGAGGNRLPGCSISDGGL